MDELIKELKQINSKVENVKKDMNDMIKLDEGLYNLLYNNEKFDFNIEKNLSQTILPNYFYRLGTLYLNGIGVISKNRLF